ncbi:alpha/beta hydrolase [Streptoalloteichus tenebrarius]|uniref:alpha/beta hydrolase n=1 Tax=Streptoalloteichus tenebrarius (strain ATCC 17920 / DSM 40477 / JCM 4838 / CBS 697.72 / NBRC 16177 / NCIMB 11028 / NRRL B-12390 / A12253. 1 / ISP 5477) TaxID=1933 RepID=UPI0020A32E8B|nr:alpha/beta fold hydrolase [Streptoalloteichus tenebrarius]
MAVFTADGVRLSGVVAAPGHDLAVVVGHGFTNNTARPTVQRVLRRLARGRTVIALDFRGHGRSGGRSTLGVDEVLDLAAGVELARRLGHRRIATLGFSMGASVVVRHAALTPEAERPDAVVAVSGPARWYERETPPMRRLHWLVEEPAGRLLARALGVRLAAAWREVPPSPVELARRVPPTPLLLVHGDRDHYFPAEHGRSLHLAAGGGAELWLERGMRHAESATSPELVDRMGAWLDANAPASSDRRQDGHVA